MTVGELRDILELFSDDMIVLINDEGTNRVADIMVGTSDISLKDSDDPDAISTKFFLIQRVSNEK